MIELKKITKTYELNDFKQHALKEINLKFRKSEFVTILGPSGSGKTTMLNILGGLDRYTTGDLKINDKSTKNFKDYDWDSYRNNSVGFVFQSYNLISHISILDNVMMGMTLSGVNSKIRKEKALKVLTQVGLKEHANKKPNQLSGGQMQRVSIARAIVNDPDIILADEPTGALDSVTSKQIMELLKEISKTKLVVMVSHNEELSESYSDRIIRLKDGKIISDTNEVKEETKTDTYVMKRTSMSFLTALKLSSTNIVTKIGRTTLTAFASSIGIIGIALILSLSNGFDKQIDVFESDTLSSFPIMISTETAEMNVSTMQETKKEANNPLELNKEEANFIYPYDIEANKISHTNNITVEYMDYINQIKEENVRGISYYRIAQLNLLTNYNDEIKNITGKINMTSLPKDTNNTNSYLKGSYDLLHGNLPENNYEIVLMVNSQNEVDTKTLESLGIDSEKEKINLEDIVGKEIKLITNNDNYISYGEYFLPNSNLNEMYESENNLTLKIVGVVRAKEDDAFADIMSNMTMSNVGGILYKEELALELIEINKTSKIVEAQLNSDKNVMTGETFDNESSKSQFIQYLGGTEVPFLINIFPTNFETKTEILNYLDEYNEDLTDADKIIYTDMADTITTLTSGIMDAITIVLIAFSAISLIVSSIMIGIITYISVLERTKEIGILRSLGARKKDVTRVFNAETFIIGLLSGTIGIIIALLLTIPANIIIENITNLKNVAVLNPLHAIILIIISLTLTVIGGLIPAKMASKKDPIIALRTE